MLLNRRCFLLLGLVTGPSLFRPLDIVCRQTCVLPGILSFFFSFFRQLPAELAERNLTISGHMAGSNVIWKCMSEMWARVSVPHTNQRSKNHFFPRFRDLKANLTAYIFRMKQDIHKRASAMQTIGVSYIVSNRHELWSTNGLKSEVSFHTPSVNSAFHFIARLRRQRLAHGTQPNFARQWMVNLANNLP